MPNEVVIHVKGSDETGPAFQKATQGAKGFGSALSVAVGIGIAQAPVAFGNLTRGASEAANAAAEDEAATLRLKKAIENTGASYAVYGPKVEGAVTAAQKMAFADDDSRAALSLLMAQTGDADEAMRRMALGMDVARGAGIPLEAASKLLGKVTEENVNVFKKMGINLEAGATEAEAFAALQAKFGGQADAYAKSTAGQMEQTKIQMGELQEEMGYKLLPVMNKLAGVMLSLPAPLQMGLFGFKELAGALGPMSPMLAALLPGLGSVIAATWSHVAALVAQAAAMIAANLPIIACVAAIAAIVAIIILCIKHWDDIKAAMNRVPWQKVVDAAKDFKDKLLGAFKAVLNFLKDHWKEIAVILSGPFAPLVALATDAFGIRSALQGAMTALVTFVGARINDIVKFVTDLPGNLLSAVGNILTSAASIGVAIKDGIVGGITGLAGALTEIGRGAWNALVQWLDDNIKIDLQPPGWAKKLGAPGLTWNPDLAWMKMAQGGIVTRPTLALLGERGAEAVIPLGRGGGYQGGQAPIHIHVQGSILSERDIVRIVRDAHRQGRFRNAGAF